MVEVPQQGLEGVGVSAISQEVDGEGVTETVGVGIGDSSAFSETTDEVAKCVTGEGAAQMIGKQWIVILGIRAGGQVAPDSARGGGAYVYGGRMVGQFQVTMRPPV
jgi:hypothetical protein